MIFPAPSFPLIVHRLCVFDCFPNERIPDLHAFDGPQQVMPVPVDRHTCLDLFVDRLKPCGPSIREFFRCEGHRGLDRLTLCRHVTQRTGMKDVVGDVVAAR